MSNQISNTVTALNVGPTGALTAVPGSPFEARPSIAGESTPDGRRDGSSLRGVTSVADVSARSLSLSWFENERCSGFEKESNGRYNPQVEQS